MAIGDPIRIAAGIPVPNYRFTRWSDFLYSSLNNLPDGWTQDPGNTGTLTTDAVTSPIGLRALLMRYRGTTGQAGILRSAPSHSGSIPMVTVAGQLIAFRVSFQYYCTAQLAMAINPILTFWDAARAVQYNQYFPVISGSQTAWGRYDQTVTIDLSTPTIGHIKDHLDFCFRFQQNNGAVSSHFTVPQVVVSYSLVNPFGAIGYDTLSSALRPQPDEFAFQDVALARLERQATGQMRRVDPTGGASARKINLSWIGAARSDKKILQAAWDYCEGRLWFDNASLNPFQVKMPAPVAGPVVLEPFANLADQSEGQRPEEGYFWLMQPPRMVPFGGWLSGLFNIDAAFEEHSG